MNLQAKYAGRDGRAGGCTEQWIVRGTEIAVSHEVSDFEESPENAADSGQKRESEPVEDN